MVFVTSGYYDLRLVKLFWKEFFRKTASSLTAAPTSGIQAGGSVASSGLPYAGTTTYRAANPNSAAACAWYGLSSTSQSTRNRRTSFQADGTSSHECDSANHRPS